jgi:hypothetical protein
MDCCPYIQARREERPRGFSIRQVLNEGPLAPGRIAIAWSFRKEISAISVVYVLVWCRTWALRTVSSKIAIRDAEDRPPVQ